MRKFIKKWLGIESNEDRIDLQHKTLSNLLEKQRKSESKISANQSKIDAVNRKLLKH